MSAFSELYDGFIQSYIDKSNETNMGLYTLIEEQWPSPCIQKDIVKGEHLGWLPYKKEQYSRLDNLEHALDIKIPSALQYLFGSYFSHDINARCEEGELTILQAWNADDFDRLQKNLIAHVLMKRRLKQADTLFFALTDIEDILLSIDVNTQAVVAEQVGQKPHKVIADNLEKFIASLSAQPQFVTLQ